MSAVNLADVSTYELANELYRRRVRAVDCLPDLRLPGLTIRPTSCRVVWRGREVGLRPREMEVLHAIASAHPHSVNVAQLAIALFESATEHNKRTARVYISELRSLLPDLLNDARGQGGKGRGMTSGYYLAGVERVATRTPVRIVGAITEVEPKRRAV